MADYPYRKTETIHGIRVDVKARTPEELGAKFALKVQQIEKNMITSGGSVPVNKWVEHYFDLYVAEKVSSGVLADRKSMYKNHIRPYIGGMKVRDVNTGHCQNIINNMSGYSKDRIDKACQLLFNIFKKARSEKLIYENPADDLIRPDAVDGQGRAATMQERALMLMVAKEHKGGLWLRTILSCGFRPGETRRFKGAHINYDAGLVYIDGTKSAAAKRIVPAPADLLADFKALNLAPDEYVFKNANGDKLLQSAATKLWYNFKRAMNIKAGCKVYRNQLIEPLPVADDLVPYCFRHAFATDLKDANIPYRIRQELMGHADSSVTDNYTHRTEASLNTARAALEAFRASQRHEIDAAIREIEENGYNKHKAAENLTEKFFPHI